MPGGAPASWRSLMNLSWTPRSLSRRGSQNLVRSPHRGLPSHSRHGETKFVVARRLVTSGELVRRLGGRVYVVTAALRELVAS